MSSVSESDLDLGRVESGESSDRKQKRKLLILVTLFFSFGRAGRFFLLNLIQ
jgi:hypothetical protein